MPLPSTKGAAQRRAAQIRAFRAELADLRSEGIDPIAPERLAALGAHHDAMLVELAGRYDIDRTAAEERLSLGMRLASAFGAAALIAAVVSFFYRIWGSLPTSGKVAALTAAPMIALAAMAVAIRRERTLLLPHPTTTHVRILASGLFALTCAIRLLALVGFPNDHFLYLAPAQQMLAGELPSRDFVDPGTPLMYVVSATARLIVDSPLLAEASVVSIAFGLAAALTAYAAFLASGSLWLAMLVTIAEIALFPRSYHYPKLLVYAAGVLAMWGYASMPSWRRAALLAACVVVAFLFRHDHGLSLGAAAITTAALAGVAWKDRVRSVLQIAGLVMVLVLPYLLYLEATTGVAQHLASVMAYGRAEFERAMIGLPSFDWSAMTSPENARVSLFHTFHLLPVIAIAVLAWDRTRATPRARSEWPKILPVAVLAIVANVTSTAAQPATSGCSSPVMRRKSMCLRVVSSRADSPRCVRGSSVPSPTSAASCSSCVARKSRWRSFSPKATLECSLW